MLPARLTTAAAHRVAVRPLKPRAQGCVDLAQERGKLGGQTIERFSRRRGDPQKRFGGADSVK